MDPLRAKCCSADSPKSTMSADSAWTNSSFATKVGALWLDDATVIEKMRRVTVLHAVCKRLLMCAPENRPRSFAAFSRFVRSSRMVYSYTVSPLDLAAAIDAPSNILEALVTAVPCVVPLEMIEPLEDELVSSVLSLWAARSDNSHRVENTKEQVAWFMRAARVKRSYSAAEICDTLSAFGLIRIGHCESISCSDLTDDLCASALPPLPWLPVIPWDRLVTKSEVSRTGSVPGAVVGRFIGKNGAALRELEARANTQAHEFLQKSPCANLRSSVKLRVVKDASRHNHDVLITLSADLCSHGPLPDFEGAVASAHEVVTSHVADFYSAQRSLCLPAFVASVFLRDGGAKIRRLEAYLTSHAGDFIQNVRGTRVPAVVKLSLDNAQIRGGSRRMTLEVRALWSGSDVRPQPALVDAAANSTEGILRECVARKHASESNMRRAKLEEISNERMKQGRLYHAELLSSRLSRKSSQVNGFERALQLPSSEGAIVVCRPGTVRQQPKSQWRRTLELQKKRRSLLRTCASLRKLNCSRSAVSPKCRPWRVLEANAIGEDRVDTTGVDDPSVATQGRCVALLAEAHLDGLSALANTTGLCGCFRRLQRQVTGVTRAAGLQDNHHEAIPIQQEERRIKSCRKNRSGRHHMSTLLADEMYASAY